MQTKSRDCAMSVKRQERQGSNESQPGCKMQDLMYESYDCPSVCTVHEYGSMRPSSGGIVIPPASYQDIPVPSSARKTQTIATTLARCWRFSTPISPVSSNQQSLFVPVTLYGVALGSTLIPALYEKAQAPESDQCASARLQHTAIICSAIYDNARLRQNTVTAQH